MNNFEVPAIPKIFVPQKTSTKSESQKSTKVQKKSSKNADQKSGNNSQQKTDSDIAKNITETPLPQLCPSCSQILLSYFVPLQQYVNEVVQMARGDSKALPVFPLLNITRSDEILNQTSDEREEQNESYIAYKHNDKKSQSNEKVVDNQSVNQWKQNQTKSQKNSQNDCNQNQSRNNENELNVGSVDHQIEQQYQRPESSHTSHSNQQQSIERRQTSDELSVGRSHPRSERPTEEITENNSEIPTSTPRDSIQQTNDEFIESHSEVKGAEYEGTGGIASPYAYVTIAYNNLSATNAIILANSLLLTNNKSMNFIDKNGNKSLIEIPFIILIGGSIDPILKDAIAMVFDEVISQPMDVRVALLNDESFGVQQIKLQLWKELLSYEKCLYLDSSTLVVGRITNLFDECEELSACVDWLFPDYFNCSVFVFEPSLTTYEQIIGFATFHQKCSSQKDEGVTETLDEMTLLNQFFGHKWNRISFIYNYVKNDSIYTQIPAFMKFGDSIKIVNFGHMMSQSGGLGNQSGMSSVQPWHILFDLLLCSQQDVIKAMPIDNYSKFYLNCFTQRLWPLVQNSLTPLLMTKYGIGRREWSIFDLIRLLSTESGLESDDHMFTQMPITFRRIKSPVEKIREYKVFDTEDNNDNQIVEQMPTLSLEESEDCEELDQKLNAKTEIEDKEEKEQKEKSDQQKDDRSKREWEAGRIDWMGAHQSDRIINRLKKLIKNE